MKLNINYKYIFLVVFAGLFFAGCAKIVAPTGGPKDEQHPLIVEIHPASYTTNFEADKVKITFDEFIQLKDLNQNLLIIYILEILYKITTKEIPSKIFSMYYQPELISIQCLFMDRY